MTENLAVGAELSSRRPRISFDRPTNWQFSIVLTTWLTIESQFVSMIALHESAGEAF